MTKDLINKFIEETAGIGENFVVEVGHTSIGLNNGEISYGQLLSGNRIIPEGLIESIIEGLELVKLIEESRKKVNITISLSDLHGVNTKEREIIKSVLEKEKGLIGIFKSIGFESDFLEEYKNYLLEGNIILQSNGTSLIRNKIAQIKDRYKNPEKIFEDKGYLLFEITIGDFSGIILFSKGCFEDQHNILNKGIPLILGEKGGILATQCGPTVTGIQKQTIGNRKDLIIITVDNKNDLSIKTKSIRGQELLKVLYGISSGFLTPINSGKLSFIHNYGKQETEYDYKQFLKKCIEGLINSGYDSAKIYGSNDYLFSQDGKDNNNNIECDLGFCNINKND